MNLLNKLTIKNLKLNKKRTIVTIIGITLSVALITAVSTMYMSLIKSLINFETYEKGNFHIAYYNVPKSDLNIFEENRKIETINLTSNIGYAKINSKNKNKPYVFIKGFTKSSLENLSIKLVEGRLPQNENEIVIPTHLKTNGRVELKIGSTITLDVGKRINLDDSVELTQDNFLFDNEDIVNTTSKTYKIVGIIERPASNIEDYSAPGYTFITLMDEKALMNNVDVYAKYTKDGTKNAYKVTANILGVDEYLFEKYYKGEATSEEAELALKELQKQKYKININSYLINLETDPLGTNNTGDLVVVVGIVIGIIIVTSVFCIKNSFDISITEKIKQYGMLKSIGATKKQIKKNVFYEASVLGLIGIPLGLLLGLFASFILIIVSNYFLQDMIASGLKLVLSISLLSLVLSIILGTITIYFSAFRSAHKASRISPIDSIRNSANIKIKSKKLKSPKIVHKLFGIGGDISYKNIKRNKKKYRTTVISIIVSVSIFIALYSFMSTAFLTVDNELKISEYNISLTAYNLNETYYNKLIETTKFDNIEDYVILREVGFTFKDIKYNPKYIDFLGGEPTEENDNYFALYTLGEEQYNKYLKELGLKYDDIKDKAILLDNQKFAKYIEKKNKYEYKTLRKYDYNVGDKINGQINELKDYTLEIGYISDKLPFGLKTTNGTIVIISDELYEQIKINDISYSIEIDYQSSNADKLQDDIDDYLKDEDNYSLYNSLENYKMMNNLFTLIAIFLYGFIIVISLIGITNIFNTITTNMFLRRQEFAMLKSIGMTNSEFKKMIRLESIFIGVKSLIIGIPIGLVLSYLIYYFLGKDAGIAYKLPILAIIISIIAVLLLISSLMKYSMNKINKQNTIETIRNENI